MQLGRIGARLKPCHEHEEQCHDFGGGLEPGNEVASLGVCWMETEFADASNSIFVNVKHVLQASIPLWAVVYHP